MTLILKKNMMDDIVKHSLNDYPKEACGIMIGESRGKIKIVKKVFVTKNKTNSPSRYEIDPEEQIRIYQEAEKNGLDVIGFYHSHPYWEPYPSLIDRSLAFYEDISYCIYSVVTRTLASFIWDGHKFIEEQVKII